MASLSSNIGNLLGKVVTANPDFGSSNTRPTEDSGIANKIVDGVGKLVTANSNFKLSKDPDIPSSKVMFDENGNFTTKTPQAVQEGPATPGLSNPFPPQFDKNGNYTASSLVANAQKVSLESVDKMNLSVASNNCEPGQNFTESTHYDGGLGGGVNSDGANGGAHGGFDKEIKCEHP